MVPPGPTGSGLAVFTATRSGSATVTVALALLLRVFASGSFSPAVAVFVTVPAVLGAWTLSVTVGVKVPTATVPRAQLIEVTGVPLVEHVPPTVLVTET